MKVKEFFKLLTDSGVEFKYYTPGNQYTIMCNGHHWGTLFINESVVRFWNDAVIYGTNNWLYDACNSECIEYHLANLTVDDFNKNYEKALGAYKRAMKTKLIEEIENEST